MTKTVSVHLPDSLLVKVDALAPDRDDFFRHAIEEKIARVHGDDTGLVDLQRRNQILRELDDSEGW
jgi:Arc/MetJ-type ribon-helix-helix transcriptional regulator